MKNIVLFLLILFLVFSCKNVFKGGDQGDFALVNYSNKVVEFVWIAPEGDLFPTSKNISVGYGQTYKIDGLNAGIYDIAIDFKNEYNSFNSKKDKTLCLVVEKGISKTWIVTPSGTIEKN